MRVAVASRIATVTTAEQQQKAPRAARALAWGATGGWAVAIFVASSLPKGSAPLPGAGLDKVVHAAVFAVLGGLAALALRAEGLARARALVAGALVALGYGLLDEAHQSWTPGRTMDAQDVLADVCGGTLGALATSGRVADVALALWPKPVGGPST